MVPLLEDGASTQIILQGRFVSSPSFIKLSNHLFRPGWSHKYLFYIYFIFGVIIQYNFLYFVAQIVPALATKGSCSWLLCAPLTYTTIAGFLFCLFCFTFPHILALQDSLSSSCIFLAPVPELAFSPRNADSPYGRMVLETKIWALGGVFTSVVLL